MADVKIFVYDRGTPKHLILKKRTKHYKPVSKMHVFTFSLDLNITIRIHINDSKVLKHFDC